MLVPLELVVAESDGGQSVVQTADHSPLPGFSSSEGLSFSAKEGSSTCEGCFAFRLDFLGGLAASGLTAEIGAESALGKDVGLDGIFSVNLIAKGAQPFRFESVRSVWIRLIRQQ